METLLYCQLCGAELVGRRKKYCGPRMDKLSCAYKALVKQSIKYTKTDKGREVARQSSLKRKAKIAVYYKDWYRQNGRKRTRKHQLAHYAVRDAIREGTLIKPSACLACGSSKERIEGHHKDYSKPLEVDWLCQSCHKKEHRNT